MNGVSLRHHLGGESGARRQGALITTELIFILPLVVYTALVVFQFLLIHAAYARVQAAAIAGADLAAQGRPIAEVHSEVGMVLGFLAGADYETRMQYVDTNSNFPPVGSGTLEAEVDVVAVGVRIPMGLVTTNYLGLLGTTVNRLALQSVVAQTLDVDVTVP